MLSPSARQGAVRSIAVAALALAMLVAAPAARAHSVLIATEPANDTVVARSPARVLLRFNEPVETALGSVQVYDGSGKRVDAGKIERPSPREVTVGVERALARGTYTVAWRAVSADSDPINGAFVFHVQAPGPHPSGIAAQVLEGTPKPTSAVYTGARFFEFLFLILAAGGVAALLYPLRSADERIRGRLCTLLAACAGALAALALLAIPLQGAAATASGLREGFRWDVVESVAGTRFGKVELVRVGLALVLLALALVLGRAKGGAREAAQAGAAVAAAGLVATPPFAGHATVEGAVAVLADIAHVVAASAWVGGLAFVVLALRFALEERWALATRSVPRFSTMAVVAVALLLAGGITNGYLQVRSWRGLWETEYGLLLLAKIALVVPLLGLGAFNNRFVVPRLRAGVAQPRERRRFLQAAGVELAIMVAIVGVTAVLVNAAPAKNTLESHGGRTTALVDLGGIEAHLAVEPGTPGPNAIHLEFASKGSGEPPALAEVKVAASLPARRIGPLDFEAKPSHEHGHGAWAVTGADLPIPGEWELRIEARRGEFELLTETVNVEIKGE
ncbi:MAG: CopD family protein [Thermoleophilia bacterium]|nr:CopD family protein [Thermoleophilia bacterium]